MMACSRNRSNNPISSLDLDLDLWAEILKRLPAGKSPCRLRCVCKSWNSLISSSWFISHHHSFNAHRRRRSHNNNTYFLNIHRPPRTYSLYSTTPGGSGTHHSLLPPEVWRLPNFEPGTSWAYQHHDVIAVSHGLVCLSLGRKGVGPAILWNPTIGKYLEISTEDHPPHWQPVVGFGFDRRNDDFKVVRGSSSDPCGCPMFDVFSTRRRGPWRPVKSKSCTVNGRHFSLGNCCYRGISKGANIYWLITRCIPQGRDTGYGYTYTDSKGRPCERALLVFDCEREEFEARDLPREIIEHGKWYGGSRLWLFVSNTSGMLSILTLTRSANEGEELEEWVMDDECGSWTMRTMRDLRDVVEIQETVVVINLQVVRQSDMSLNLTTSYPTPFDDGLSKKRSSAPHLWNGFVFEPSLYLMDANTHLSPSPYTS